MKYGGFRLIGSPVKRVSHVIGPLAKTETTTCYDDVMTIATSLNRDIRLIVSNTPKRIHMWTNKTESTVILWANKWSNFIWCNGHSDGNKTVQKINRQNIIPAKNSFWTAKGGFMQKVLNVFTFVHGMEVLFKCEAMVNQCSLYASCLSLPTKMSDTCTLCTVCMLIQHGLNLLLVLCTLYLHLVSFS